MSEFGEQRTEVSLDAIRLQENAIEEANWESFLARNLFHDKHLEAAAEVWQDDPRYETYLDTLKQEFLADKRYKNMGDRFQVAISDKYVGKIHVVKLGVTTNPDIDGYVDGLRSEYHDLVNWMTEQPNIKLKQYSRAESQRDISVRHPQDTSVSDLAIVVRNRPLVEGLIDQGEHLLKIGIAKRMVFMASARNMMTLLLRDPALESEHSLALVEEWLKAGVGPKMPIRGAVRTSYYLATDIVSSEDDISHLVR